MTFILILVLDLKVDLDVDIFLIGLGDILIDFVEIIELELESELLTSAPKTVPVINNTENIKIKTTNIFLNS